MAQARVDATVLHRPENVKLLGNIMKTNVSACSSIGSPYISQLTVIYFDLLGLYKAVSGLISEAVKNQGPIATKTPVVRGSKKVLVNYHSADY
jgi:exportin-1